MSALVEKEKKTGLIGKKLGMTSLFDEMGKNIPCTIIELGPCYVTQIKVQEKDGYEAVQIAYADAKEKNITKVLKGHYKKSGVTPKRKVMEIDYLPRESKLGDEITVDLFQEGEFVDVVGTSKGKGFQGVVKRHGFRGVGDATHGQHNRLRAPGSIGAGSDPSRVFKGIKMAGQTGNSRVTVQNLKVLKIDKDKNVIVVSGAVPGHNNAYVSVHK